MGDCVTQTVVKGGRVGAHAVLVLLVACVEPPVTLCEAGVGETRDLLVSQLYVGLLDPSGEFIYGLDLDNHVTLIGDDGGCGGFGDVDLVSPPPFNVEGIDNIFGGVITPYAGDHVATMRRTFQEGSHLLALSISGLDNTGSSDACAHIAFNNVTIPGGSSPTVDTEGLLAADQQVEVLSSAGSTGEVVRVEDWARGRMESLVLPFVAADGDLEMEFELVDAQIHFRLTDSGIDEGIIGGAMSLDDVRVAFGELIPDLPGLNYSSFADVQDCERVSIGYFFRAQPTILLD